MPKFTILFFLFISTFLSAQVIVPITVNVGGGTDSLNSNFIVDWSIGESSSIQTFTKYFFSNAILTDSIFFTSGILQPYDIIPLIFNANTTWFTNTEIVVFPVPAIDYAFLDFRVLVNGLVAVDLFDQNGKLIGAKRQIVNNSTFRQKWNISNLSNNWYFFRVSLFNSDGSLAKKGVFKLIKIK